MMFGHVENMSHVAHHLLKLNNLQLETNGITEFVPLPFVADEAPIYRKGFADQDLLLKNLSNSFCRRILFNGKINNIQGSCKNGSSRVKIPFICRN